jgi:hypothetical protein
MASSGKNRQADKHPEEMRFCEEWIAEVLQVPDLQEVTEC